MTTDGNFLAVFCANMNYELCLRPQKSQQEIIFGDVGF